MLEAMVWECHGQLYTEGLMKTVTRDCMCVQSARNKGQLKSECVFNKNQKSLDPKTIKRRSGQRIQIFFSFPVQSSNECSWPYSLTST